MSKKAAELCNEYLYLNASFSNSAWIEDENECAKVRVDIEKRQSEIREEIASMIVESDKSGIRFNPPSRDWNDSSDMRHILVEGKYVVVFCLNSFDDPQDEISILEISPVLTDISI